MARLFMVAVTLLVAVCATASALCWSKGNCRIRSLQPACSRDDEPYSSQASIDTSGSLKAKDGSTIHYRLSGVVFFNVTDEYRTEITATIKGLEPLLAISDKFALRIHKYGTCDQTGGSYNPCDKDQSNDPLTQNRHIGDVYVANCASDELNIRTIDNQVKLSGPLSVVGRSVVIQIGIRTPWIVQRWETVGCAPIVIRH